MVFTSQAPHNVVPRTPRPFPDRSRLQTYTIEIGIRAYLRGKCVGSRKLTTHLYFIVKYLLYFQVVTLACHIASCTAFESSSHPTSPRTMTYFQSNFYYYYYTLVTTYTGLS